MLPLDEEPFEIDANTRSIKIPAAFNKCAGVQNDNLCEIITFTVDRYFDYVDLERTSIAIQWRNINGTEGIHIVDPGLRDMINYPGKIRFGWPLSSKITETPGDVIFSIRFFMAPEAGGEVKYILNTLPAKINIKQTLQITDPNAVEESNISNLFKEFVENSQIGSLESALPPYFVNPGKNLEPYGALTADNTLQLKAQGVSGDQGFISYEWYFRSSEAKDNEKDLLIVDTTENPNPTYGISIIYEPIQWKTDKDGNPIKERVPGEKYFTYDESTGLGTPFYDFGEAEWPELYERFSVLTIKDTATPITGEYYVKAYNQVSDSVVSNSSSHCIIPSPGEVEIVKDLDSHVFIDKDHATELKFAINNENNQLSNYVYTWKKDGLDEKIQKDEGINLLASAFSPQEVGYYSVDYAVNLNRTTKEGSSKKCKVTYKPEPPQVEELLQITENQTINILTLEEDDALPHYKRGEGVHLKIITDLDDIIASEFLTEGLTYQWQINVPDIGDYVNIEAIDAVGKGYVQLVPGAPNELIAYVPQSEYTEFALSCVITNTISGESKSVNTKESYKPFIVSWTDDESVVEETPEVEEVPSEEV